MKELDQAPSQTSHGRCGIGGDESVTSQFIGRQSRSSVETEPTEPKKARAQKN
jgi:hypothetical protein